MIAADSRRDATRERPTMQIAIASPSTQAMEQLMSATAAASNTLDGILQVISPAKPMMIESDCCSSNNYPTQES